MLGGRKVSEAVRDGVEKAGTLVSATLAIACAALGVALIALAMVMQVRGKAGA